MSSLSRDEHRTPPAAIESARGHQSRMWVCIGALALAIRLTALDRFSYWLDEMLEVFTIHSGWGAMWHTLRDQVLNPPLDYVLQKIFDSFGPTDAARRILPAMWGTGGVVSLGLLVGRRAGPKVGAVTAICLAFAPYHVRYSQEVRPYALGMFLTALTLLLVDRCLEKPSAPRMLSIVAGGVAVGYTMFLGALVLVIAGAALILDDAFTGDPPRRSAARRLLAWSPALIIAGAAAYFPWLTLVWHSLHAPAISTPPVFSMARVARVLSYFGFGLYDWYPLGAAGFVFIVLVLTGSGLAVSRYRLRFLVVWAVVGVAAIEILEERHGVFDSVFHFVPAGVALTALAAVPIGWLAERRARAWLAAVALAAFLCLDARGLIHYFQKGRPDWRPVAKFLREQPAAEPVLAAGAYTQLCLGYYVNGPEWLCCPGPQHRAILNVANDASELGRFVSPSTASWFVAPVDAQLGPAVTAGGIPGRLFPTADGGVVVRRLDVSTEAGKRP